MSSSFTLYNTIKGDVKNKLSNELTNSEVENFKDLISNLDQRGRDLTYALIRAHSLLIETDSKYPFGSEVKKQRKNETEDIEFRFENLPTALKQILYRFLQIHINHLKLMGD